MTEQIIKLKAVSSTFEMSPSSIYRKAADPDDDFPKPIKLGKRSSGWLKSELDDWVARRVEASRNNGGLL